MTTQQQIEDAFAAAMKRLVAAHPTLKLELDWVTAVAILSHLQLALRHPGTVGHSARTVREFVDGMIAAVERVEPPLGPLLRMGDDPIHDVPRT